MKVRWIQLCRWMLGLLGVGATVSACDGFGLPRAEYGQPNMDYSVKGKVVDFQTGEGVAGIEVNHTPYGKQIDTTGTDGSFELSGNTWPSSELEVTLKDIDPENDGAYLTSRNTIALQKVRDGDGNWDRGYYEANDAVLLISKK